MLKNTSKALWVCAIVLAGSGLFILARRDSLPQIVAPTSNPTSTGGAFQPGIHIIPAPAETQTTIPTIAAPEGVTTFLLLGSDQRPQETNEPPRTDALMLLRVDFNNEHASLLSFPRDLWIPLADLVYYDIQYGRINTAYYFGEKLGMPGGGVEILKRTIFLDFGIPIDHYLLIDFQGLINIVDLLGGIELDVPKAIYDPAFPTDDYGTFLFELDAGLQHLDGITALRYARTRSQDSDTERIKRQQAILVAIADKLLQADTLTLIPALYETMDGNFETDLSLIEILWFASHSTALSTANLRTYNIDQTMLIPHITPGGAHVWLPKPEQLDTLVWEFASVPTD